MARIGLHNYQLPIELQAYDAIYLSQEYGTMTWLFIEASTVSGRVLLLPL